MAVIGGTGLSEAWAEEPRPAVTRPAVVELFTSQGCSSCPPADAFLGQLARRGDVVTLAFHVDYWDRLGWKDPFSSPEATARQRAYAGALGLTNVYTPQMVIDGVNDRVGSEPDRVLPLLAPKAQSVPVTLGMAGRRLRIDLAASPGAPKSEVVLLAVSNRAETTVPRGENAGRVLTEYSIVRAVVPLGDWQGEARSFEIDSARLPSEASTAVVLVQRAGVGAVLGVTRMEMR